jgi:hypothetical protein
VAPSPKKGKRARKAEARVELIESLRDDQYISSQEAARLKEKVGVAEEKPSAPPPVRPDDVAGVFTSVMESRAARDRRVTPLDTYDQAKILALIEGGLNREGATKAAGVDYRRFLHTLKNDAAFASDIVVEENNRVGRAQQLMYDHMETYSDVEMAEKLIKQHVYLQQGAQTRRIQKLEFKLKEKVINRQLGSNVTEARPDLSVIPPAHWDDYVGLEDKVGSGGDLTADEALRYARYHAAIARASAPPPPPGLVAHMITNSVIKDENI